MASIVRRVLDKHEFSEKDFRSVFENQNGEPYSVLKRRFPQLMNDNCTYKEIEITDNGCIFDWCTVACLWVE